MLPATRPSSARRMSGLAELLKNGIAPIGGFRSSRSAGDRPNFEFRNAASILEASVLGQGVVAMSDLPVVVGCRLVVSAAGALSNATQVFGPTMPSATRPR